MQDTQFDLVNLQDSGMVVVGQRTGGSEWKMEKTIVWAGGSTEVPSDRALAEIGALVRHS